ncbi:hypothetical protein SAMN02745120_1950 [Acetoanaerobium noterae]|jgi:hypothetical protein|uniref:Uncharacterized protein n=2 Tax=Acetoanaerobium TaxID=186831 RepID=E3PXV6_ACESD|nr:MULTISPECIES: hypothetical protein [Acetoanaerobium]MBP8762838.1 hypothetical protein [Acetoanaerobium sp.]MDK2803292.1 hypothetical protein [Peptostreptococcaceae bacterium]MBP9499533.1 hypothetical protein [Acetoanaerobium sp.]MBP9561923.1 hypothetical protein [Acetoanaerobium sp.]CBH21271.1 conserved protein of unknown function [Acetoanaerobium sticklandii]
MINFDKISIDQISKRDLLIIIQALDYTYENTKIEDFSKLKDSLLEELRLLAEVPTQDELIKILSA